MYLEDKTLQDQVVEALGRHLIGPVLTAIVGAIGILLRQWYQTRDARYQQQQGRSEATERIEFIEKWLRVQQQACPPEEFEGIKRAASLQLEQIYLTMFKAPVSSPSADKPYLFRLRRALLLFWPTSFGAWITHLIFYLVLMIALLFTTVPFADLEEGESRVTLILGSVVFLIVLSIPASLIRALAIRIDNKNRARMNIDNILFDRMQKEAGVNNLTLPTQ